MSHARTLLHSPTYTHIHTHIHVHTHTHTRTHTHAGLVSKMRDFSSLLSPMSSPASVYTSLPNMNTHDLESVGVRESVGRGGVRGVGVGGGRWGDSQDPSTERKSEKVGGRGGGGGEGGERLKCIEDLEIELASAEAKTCDMKAAMKMWKHKVRVRFLKGENTRRVFVFASAEATRRQRMRMCYANVDTQSVCSCLERWKHRVCICVCKCSGDNA